MLRRSLGSTGLKVSVLGFGASPLGGVFQVRLESHASASPRRAPTPVVTQTHQPPAPLVPVPGYNPCLHA